MRQWQDSKRNAWKKTDFLTPITRRFLTGENPNMTPIIKNL